MAFATRGACDMASCDAETTAWGGWRDEKPWPFGIERDEMSTLQPNNPLHGVTLEMMLREMVERWGWEGIARDMPIACFKSDPSITSALKYLRKAPRARAKVEALYAQFVAGKQG